MRLFPTTHHTLYLSTIHFFLTHTTAPHTSSQVPYDVFYPFVLTSPAARSAPLSPLSMALVVGLALYVLAGSFFD